jgi:hypothetical protein
VEAVDPQRVRGAPHAGSLGESGLASSEGVGVRLSVLLAGVPVPRRNGLRKDFGLGQVELLLGGWKELGGAGGRGMDAGAAGELYGEL